MNHNFVCQHIHSCECTITVRRNVSMCTPNAIGPSHTSADGVTAACQLYIMKMYIFFQVGKHHPHMNHA